VNKVIPKYYWRQPSGNDENLRPITVWDRPGEKGLREPERRCRKGPSKKNLFKKPVKKGPGREADASSHRIREKGDSREGNRPRRPGIRLMARKEKGGGAEKKEREFSFPKGELYQSLRGRRVAFGGFNRTGDVQEGRSNPFPGGKKGPFPDKKRGGN